MGYKIVYGKGRNSKEIGRKLRVILMTVGFFLFFLQGVSYFWPEGMDLIRNLLPIEEAEQTFRAAEVFSQELGSGFSVSDAVRNFIDALG